jgi:hypothetical protein
MDGIPLEDAGAAVADLTPSEARNVAVYRIRNVIVHLWYSCQLHLVPGSDKQQNRDII